MEFRPFPIGVDDFEKLRSRDYYYVDKTLLIKELKVSDSYKNMQDAAQKAVSQINERCCSEELSREGYSSIVCFGVAFYKKYCAVTTEKHKL